jgi:acetyl esterase/lipase
MIEAGIDAVRALLLAKPRPNGFAERRQRLDAIAEKPVAPDVTIEAAAAGNIPLEWSYAPGSDPTRVLLFFHGGGYCSGSIASHRGMVVEAGRAGQMRTLAVGYRLAPEHPFPAALEDGLAAYRYLLTQGIAPSAIALGGDSAGGGLALAMMLRLRAEAGPLPACAWLVSPWVDLAMTGESLKTKADADPLIHKDYLEELASAYLNGHDPADPLVSPLKAGLEGLPPLLIQVGSDETLLDDATRIAARAGAADVAVTLEIWPRMIHAWHLWAYRLEEGREALAAAGAYLKARLDARKAE